MTDQPQQPIYVDEEGTKRFRMNAVVRYLYDNHPGRMNQILTIPWTFEDLRQFRQLIGYSVAGYRELGHHEPLVEDEGKVQKHQAKKERSGAWYAEADNGSPVETDGETDHDYLDDAMSHVGEAVKPQNQNGPRAELSQLATAEALIACVEALKEISRQQEKVVETIRALPHWGE